MQMRKTLDWVIHCAQYLMPFTCPWNWKPHITNIMPSKDQNEWGVGFEVCEEDSLHNPESNAWENGGEQLIIKKKPFMQTMSVQVALHKSTLSTSHMSDCWHVKCSAVVCTVAWSLDSRLLSFTLSWSVYSARAAIEGSCSQQHSD